MPDGRLLSICGATLLLYTTCKFSGSPSSSYLRIYKAKEKHNCVKHGVDRVEFA